MDRKRALDDRLRQQVYAGYGGAKCACCGEDNERFLTIDHKHNDGAEHRKGLNTRCAKTIWRWAIRNNFPPVLQILCYNCNFGKQRNGGVCPHGIKDKVHHEVDG